MGRPPNESHRQHLVVLEKRCCRCKQVKPASCFSAENRKKDGLQPRCKECEKAINRAYREANPERIKELRRKNYQRERNKDRYARYRTGFLARRKAYARTVRGRMNTLLCSARARAEKAGLPYDLDLDWLLARYESQHGTCCLTGFKLSLEFSMQVSRAHDPLSPSLDRIDPQQGYTKDNTRLVCTAVNLAMNRFGEAFFKQLCEAYLSRLTSSESGQTSPGRRPARGPT